MSFVRNVKPRASFKKKKSDGSSNEGSDKSNKSKRSRGEKVSKTVVQKSKQLSPEGSKIEMSKLSEL